MSKKKVLLRGVFINRDTNGEGVLKVGTTLIRVSTVMGILYRVLADGKKVECAASLVRSAIMNVLDNSIYWLEKYEIKDKKILFVEYVPESGYRGLLIVDNGKGFTIPKDKLTLPFISKKEDGMGLGLHLVNEIMDTIGGKVIFPDVLDFDLPIDYENGAAVALIFKEA